MTFEEQAEGVVLRVRLSPNSSACKLNGKWMSPEGEEYLKINVVSVAEKGRANQELIKFLSKNLKEAKSSFEIISGMLDRYKKIVIHGDYINLKQKLENWLEKENDGADN